MLEALIERMTRSEVEKRWRTEEIAGYQVKAKLIDIPSRSGINGGRVIKLDVIDGDDLVVHYDRGFDQQDVPRATINQIVDRLENAA